MKISTMWHWVASLWGNSRCNVSSVNDILTAINAISFLSTESTDPDFPKCSTTFLLLEIGQRWADWHGDVSHPRIGSLGLHQFITIQVETRGTIDNRDVYKLENA